MAQVKYSWKTTRCRFTLGSNQLLTHLPVAPCKTKYNFFFFLSAEEKKQPNKFKSMHVQHDRRVVLEGCAIILWGRINLLSRRKWNKVAVTIRVSSHVQNKLNNCISLDVRHVQWHSFSSSEHCGFRSLLASLSVCFWLLQVFLQVLYQSPRVPFDAELCRF